MQYAHGNIDRMIYAAIQTRIASVAYASIATTEEFHKLAEIVCEIVTLTERARIEDVEETIAKSREKFTEITRQVYKRALSANE